MPRDPQGAGTRTETKVEWRNVYAPAEDGLVREMGLDALHPSRAIGDSWEEYHATNYGVRRIAIERIETTTTITREEL